ncbi:creatininase family protein [Aliihoeflea aestuarii]|jgi:creatinine amidohydrolase|uniref:creatininase family protein n=1 Tax=Aliihoeflea aestuarii TaxID=453840 RepID=UPI002092E7C4|nr:creatininase family protein [Aliihoeflea aestuarii]MCO6391866.1 creatininase family protein [Aliihoeflea aestuarii]
MTASEITPLPAISVLPLGATEQHGPHLPFETDTLIAEAVASRLKARLAGEISLQILPVEPVGYSIEHIDVEGTKTLSFDEAVNRWIGIGTRLSERGARRFVMLNAHGGNSPLMTIVATELRVRHDMLAVATSWTRFGYPSDIVSAQEKAIGIHGGLVETSVMLAIRPDLVDMEKARDFPSAQSHFEKEFTHLRAYGAHAFGWKMSDLSPDGVTGNAFGATAEKGERILDHAVSGLADLLRDVAKFDLSTLR